MIHRLVAMAWIPNPDNLPQVNHKDEDKTNNHYTNLEWCDLKYNMNYGTRNERASQKRYKPVRCVETGEVFPSVKAAGKAVNIEPAGISACLTGHGRVTAAGYHWEYVNIDKEN